MLSLSFRSRSLSQFSSTGPHSPAGDEIHKICTNHTCTVSFTARDTQLVVSFDDYTRIQKLSGSTSFLRTTENWELPNQYAYQYWIRWSSGLRYMGMGHGAWRGFEYVIWVFTLHHFDSIILSRGRKCPQSKTSWNTIVCTALEMYIHMRSRKVKMKIHRCIQFEYRHRQVHTATYMTDDKWNTVEHLHYNCMMSTLSTTLEVEFFHWSISKPP